VPTLVVSPPAAQLRQGDTGVITISVSNTGAAAATGLKATVQLPPGLTVRGSTVDEGTPTTPGWACGGSGSTATCEIVALPPDMSRGMHISVDVADTAAGGLVTGDVFADGETIPIPPTTVTALPA
jgi:uncharacterized repeat protein (TIGR01451 family)